MEDNSQINSTSNTGIQLYAKYQSYGPLQVKILPVAKYNS